MKTDSLQYLNIDSMTKLVLLFVLVNVVLDDVLDMIISSCFEALKLKPKLCIEVSHLMHLV